jgi:hypothetical protein
MAVVVVRLPKPVYVSCVSNPAYTVPGADVAAIATFHRIPMLMGVTVGKPVSSVATLGKAVDVGVVEKVVPTAAGELVKIMLVTSLFNAITARPAADAVTVPR